MKNHRTSTQPEPELIQNARRIEMLKARELDITKRAATITATINTLHGQLEALADESRSNTLELKDLARRNDQLSLF
jgi:hypothetical protein